MKVQGYIANTATYFDVLDLQVDVIIFQDVRVVIHVTDSHTHSRDHVSRAILTGFGLNIEDPSERQVEFVL